MTSLGCIEDEAGAVPAAFVLEQNYPNPFNPSTTIHFTVVQSSDVRLQVFDVLGRSVAMLVDGPLVAGRHKVVWEAGSAPSGVYVYRIQTGRRVETKQMVLMR